MIAILRIFMGKRHVLHTRQVRGRVGEDRVGRTAQGLRNSLRGLGIGEVEGEKHHRLVQRIDGARVHADDPPSGADACSENLEPAAGPAAELDDRGTGADPGETR